MNIFVLDRCPIKAAQMQCDKHVVKMVLETAQLLCSIFPESLAPYRRTHYNHPCAIWSRTSYNNYIWLLKHGFSLAEEYKARYNKEHKSLSVIDWCSKNIKPEMFSQIEQTEFVKCMPDEVKVTDPIESYKKYYLTNKRGFAKWKRNQPSWWTDI